VSRRLTARFVSANSPAGRGLAALRGPSPGACVLAAAIPLLFLHANFQPSVSISLGRTSATAYLSDFAVLAVVLAALWSVLRDGAGALRPGLAFWAPAALLFAWIAVEVAAGHARASGYSLADHGVSAAKFAEYGLLAPAAAVLARRRRDLELLCWSFTAWSAAATFVGLLQFFGVHAADSAPAVGHRQASFLSSADFAALSGGALLIGLAALTVPRLRLGGRLGVAATATGALGMVVAGSIASVLGLATSLVVLAAVLLLRRDAVTRRDLVPRRLVVAVAVGVLVFAGTVAIRGSDLEAFARFLGAAPVTHTEETTVQTYAHRTLLSWMGFEMWKDHPLLGVGWEGSADPAVFTAYLPRMHAHFPDEAPLAFPAAAPDRHYGVQDAWIEALSDLGVPGFVLWTATFAGAAWVGLRGTLRTDSPQPLLGLLGVALLVWLWAAQGFVAGIPLDALTFLLFGLAATREPAA
jgi:O-antigen ligase